MIEKAQFVTAARSCSQRMESQTLSAVQESANANAKANLTGTVRYMPPRGGRPGQDPAGESPGAGGSTEGDNEADGAIQR